MPIKRNQSNLERICEGKDIPNKSGVSKPGQPIPRPSTPPPPQGKPEKK